MNFRIEYWHRLLKPQNHVYSSLAVEVIYRLCQKGFIKESVFPYILDRTDLGISVMVKTLLEEAIDTTH